MYPQYTPKNTIGQRIKQGEPSDKTDLTWIDRCLSDLRFLLFLGFKAIVVHLPMGSNGDIQWVDGWSFEQSYRD